MEWHPIETMPRDGREVLTTDGTFCEVLNWPPGCVLGVWALIRGKWAGSCVTHTQPKWWRDLPPLPGTGLAEAPEAK